MTETKVIAQEPVKTTPETQGSITTAPEKPADVIVYRVQILSNSKPDSKPQITVNGDIYNTFEYFYSGLYRICAGEFRDLASAKVFQSTLRKSGYAQAFVVAFRNNVRTLDAALFK
jgi:hypothetical protein